MIHGKKVIYLHGTHIKWKCGYQTKKNAISLLESGVLFNYYALKPKYLFVLLKEISDTI